MNRAGYGARMVYRAPDPAAGVTLTAGQFDAPPRAPRPRWIALVVVALVVLLAASAGVIAWRLTRTVASSDSAPTYQLHGTLTLKKLTFNWTQGQPCFGVGTYGDLKAGADVIVAGPDAATVATGKLAGGTVSKDQLECKFAFDVAGVPGGLKHYALAIGDRKPFQLAESQLEGLVTVAVGEGEAN